MRSALKNIVFALAILSSASAFATNDSQSGSQSGPQSGNDIFAKLTQENPNETPFQLLESLYNSGVPAKISDFPTYEQCANNPNFRPMNSLEGEVLPDTKKEDLKIQVGWIYVVKDLKWVISEAQPAKNDGPLFPISPAVPEKDAYFPYVLAVGATYSSYDAEDLSNATGGACTNVPSEKMKTGLVQVNYVFVDTPDGAQEQQSEKTDEYTGVATTTSHLVGDVIVEKEVVTVKSATAPGTKTQVSYNYFWRAEASK